MTDREVDGQPEIADPAEFDADLDLPEDGLSFGGRIEVLSRHLEEAKQLAIDGAGPDSPVGPAMARFIEAFEPLVIEAYCQQAELLHGVPIKRPERS